MRFCKGTYSLLLASGLLTLACKPGPLPNPTDSNANESETDSGPEPTDSESESESDSESESETETETGDFVPIDDVPTCSICDTVVQDCPQGEKCSPSAGTGGSCGPPSCKPIVGDRTVGESCTITDLVDDCDADSWCYPAMLDLDGPSVCIGFCVGDFECTNPDEICVTEQIYTGGIGAIGCRPRCDPLAPESTCDPGELCTFGISDFACVVAPADVPLGQACDFPHECETGLCVQEEFLTECTDDACCTSFCDVLAPDCAAGLECVLLEPAGFPESTVGGCMVPA